MHAIRTTSRPTAARWGALVLGTLVATACADLPRPLGLLRRGSHPEYTEQDLRSDLAAFAATTGGEIGGTADRISEESHDRRVQRRTILWRIRLVPMFRNAALGSDPQEAFVDTLLVAVAMYQYLDDGDGRNAFGPYQPLAIESARSLLLNLREIGARFLTDAQLERAEQEVRRLSRQEAIRGPDFATGGFERTLMSEETDLAFGWIIDLPMSPFRALEGVGSGAAAIHDFNQTADRFASIVDGIPEQLRWEAELLLFEFEDRDTTLQTVAALETLARSSEEASESLRHFQADLSAMLEGSGERLTEAQQVLAEAQQLAGPLAQITEQLRETSELWVELTRPDPEAPPGRPFDIREYDQTAAQIGSSAEELRQALIELRAVGDSDALSRAIRSASETIELTRTSGEALVDYAAWRGLWLLLAFFALLLVYRLLTTRLARGERG